MRSHNRWAWFIAWCWAVLCVTVAAAAFVRGGLSDAANAAAVLGVPVLVVGLFSWAHTSAQGPADSTTEQIEQATITLARLVRAQWRSEVRIRALRDPLPLRVRWTPCGADATRPSAPAFRTGYGDGDDLDRLVETFRGLAGRRLVVLGPPGSGKTTLAVLLALGLADRYQPGDPVPVLLSAAAWDSAHECVLVWLRRQLAQDYPALGDTRVYGASAIRDLVDDGRVLPVLDGLDEMPAARRVEALEGLKLAWGGDLPLVLTCRSDEYREVVADCGALSAAPVIEAEPVRPGAVIEFLVGSLAADPRTPRWQPVFDALTSDPAGPIAAALSSPLMVTLVRDVYGRGGTEPAELADRARFLDRFVIEDHLLNALIPARLGRHGNGPSGASRAARIDPERARAWLTFLAMTLERRGSYDLAWWRLHDDLPAFKHPRRRSLLAMALAWSAASVVFGVAAAAFGGVRTGTPIGLLLGFGATVALGTGSLLTPPAGTNPAPARGSLPKHIAPVRRAAVAAAVGSGYGWAFGLCFAVLYGPTAGIEGGLATWLLCALVGTTPIGEGLLRPGSGPCRLQFQLAGRLRLLFRTLALGTVAGLGGGTLLGCVLLLAVDLGGDRRVLWPFAGPTTGLAAGLGLAVVTWAHSPMVDRDAISPRATLRADRTLALLLAVPLVGAFVACFAAACAIDPPYGVRGGADGALHGALIGFAISFMIWLTICLNQAWTLYLVSTIWLAARGRLPWRLSAFLDDAHRLGLLRQVGALYQFRHARLQDHLVRARLHPTADQTAASRSQPHGSGGALANTNPIS